MQEAIENMITEGGAIYDRTKGSDKPELDQSAVLLRTVLGEIDEFFDGFLKYPSSLSIHEPKAGTGLTLKEKYLKFNISEGRKGYLIECDLPKKKERSKICLKFDHAKKLFQVSVGGQLMYQRTFRLKENIDIGRSMVCISKKRTLTISLYKQSNQDS